MTNIEDILGKDLKEQLLTEAAQQGRPMRELIQDAVKEYLSHGKETYNAKHRVQNTVIAEPTDPIGG